MTATELPSREPAWVVWVTAAVLVIAAFAVRAETASHTGFVCEDALITARYAENLAAGEGFVYNLGEKVLGTTTPLYTLLLALAKLLGLSVTGAAVWIGLTADALVIGLIVAGLRRVLGWPARIVFAGGYLLLGSAAVWVGSGMETGLYIFSIACTLAAAAAGRERTAFGLAGVVALVRIDGGLVLLALLAQSLLAGRRPFAGIAVYAAVTVGWFAFSLAYFGSLLPHSVAAKQAFAGLEGFARGDPWHIARLLVFADLSPGVAPGLRLGFHWVALTLAPFGLWFALRDPRLRAVAIWVLGYFAFYVHAGMQFPWYLVPFHFGLLLLAAIGAGGLLGWTGHLMTGRAVALRLTVAGALAALALVMQGMSLWNRETGWRAIYRGRQQILEMDYRSAADFLRVNTRPHVIYTGEIGYFGYYTGFPILDSVGIVSPEAVRLNRAQRPLDLVREQKPPIVITSRTDVGRRLIEQAWFRRDHVPFGWDPRQPQRAPLKRIWIRADKIVEVVPGLPAQRALLEQARLQGAGR